MSGSSSSSWASGGEVAREGDEWMDGGGRVVEGWTDRGKRVRKDGVGHRGRDSGRGVEGMERSTRVAGMERGVEGWREE